MEPLQLTVPKIPRKTPEETKGVKKCILIFTDGSEMELDVEDDQGFYRRESYKAANGKGLLIHEVYITYGHT